VFLLADNNEQTAKIQQLKSWQLTDAPSTVLWNWTRQMGTMQTEQLALQIGMGDWGHNKMNWLWRRRWRHKQQQWWNSYKLFNMMSEEKELWIITTRYVHRIVKEWFCENETETRRKSTKSSLFSSTALSW